MKKRASLLVASALAMTLSACGGGQQFRGPPKKVIDRVLKTAPGAAKPSDIVATEIALSQAEKADGVWAARAAFAAPSAIVHTSAGIGDAARMFAGLEELEGTAEWGPRTVVISCDGALAIAAGRFRNLDGKFGDYVTTWVRQKNNSYKWSYNTEWIDDPQPAPRRQFEDGDIVVTAIDAVLGLIASCPERGSPIPPPPAISLMNDNPGSAQLSKDGTLRWNWEHKPDGKKYFAVDYFYEGEWVRAIEEGVASASEE